MKDFTKILFVFIMFFSSNTIDAQTINFTDLNFRNYLRSANLSNDIAKDVNGNSMKIDTNNDYEIQVSEALNVYELKLGLNFAIFQSIEGIEYFTNLRELFSFSELLTIPNIDITALTNLELLTLSNCNVENLSVNGLANLKYFNCRNNNLQTLDLSGLTNLEELDCQTNYIQNLDLSGFTSLKKLKCQSNSLTTMDITGAINLEYIDCSTNYLTNLNLSDSPILISVRCGFNYLSTLDLSNKIFLTGVVCQKNNLTSIDLSGSLNIEWLECGYNLLQNLDILSQFSHLYILDCSYNLLTSLDLNGLNQLFVVNCSSNQLTSINLSGLSTLEYLDCQDNYLTSINVSDLFSLKNLTVNINNLQNLNVNNLNNLSKLNVIRNDLLTIEAYNIAFNGDADDQFNFNENPNLISICTNESKIDIIQNIVNQYGYVNCVVNACLLSTENYILDSDISFYPNPVSSLLNIEVKKQITTSEISIYNVMGQIVFLIPNAKDINSVDISNLKAGNYFIKVNSDKGIFNSKFIKL